jgi:hypothetical protein
MAAKHLYDKLCIVSDCQVESKKIQESIIVKLSMSMVSTVKVLVVFYSWVKSRAIQSVTPANHQIPRSGNPYQNDKCDLLPKRKSTESESRDRNRFQG